MSHIVNYLLFLTLLMSSSEKVDEHLKYLKQKPPSLVPEIFAPGFISKKGEFEFGSVFSKEGTEFFYGVQVNGKTEIKYTALVDSIWSEPRTILSHEKYECADPYLSPDEKRLYFISGPAEEQGPFHMDIWYVEKKENGWSEPINAGSNINSDMIELYPSFSQNGTMYFSSNKGASEGIQNFSSNHHDIYRSQNVDGEFQKAVSLGNSVNTSEYEGDVFIDPNERYIIFCGIRKEGLGNGDLYISFKKDDGSWTKSKNMGEPINSESNEFCPFMSKDGKYLFYASKGDIYWVDGKIIEQYR